MKQFIQPNVYHFIYKMYRNLYRRFLLVAVFASAICAANGQQNNMNGAWAGKLFRNTDSSAVDVQFTIKDNRLTSISDESKTQRWFDKAKMIQQQEGESIIFWWTYSCEFGIQSKVYKITPNAAGTATITWWKHNMDYSKMASTSDQWELAGAGLLQRSSTGELLATAKQ